MSTRVVSTVVYVRTVQRTRVKLLIPGRSFCTLGDNNNGMKRGVTAPSALVGAGCEGAARLN